MKKFLSLFPLFSLFFVSLSFAGEADVIDVQLNKSGKTNYKFTVTISHKDTGWKHYVNKWDIIDEQGTVLGTRILHHPHVDEQPFTRSLSGVEIPESIKTVKVRAHDSVHGYGGKILNVEFP